MPVELQSQYMDKTYKVIGLMSGTSLDGLDIAYCEINRQGDSWDYKILDAITVEYPEGIANNLKRAINLSAENVIKLDAELGSWMGKEVNRFVSNNQLKVDFIASHGHTVFHQPQEGFSLQIGSANAIHQKTDLPVIYDFRSLDVAKGGQGAPLVPIGDELLFSKFDACLNLGGIANISMNKHSRRIAYDICPVNMMLNELASKNGQAFDNEGEIARSGKINVELLNALNGLEHYNMPYPKSLGFEWYRVNVLPLIDSSAIPLEDRMATCLEHASTQIAMNIPVGNILITGGGALNTFLLERINAICDNQIKLVVPDENLINYKEALIFGLLGTLRLENKVNVLQSVTGAITDSCSGSIIGNISALS